MPAFGDRPQQRRRAAGPDDVQDLDRVGEAGVGLLDDRTELLEGARRGGRQRLDLGMQLLDVAEPRRPGDAQAADAVIEPDAEIRGRGVHRRHVARVGRARPR